MLLPSLNLHMIRYELHTGNSTRNTCVLSRGICILFLQSITVPRYRKLIAKAYCSIAELYMTDLCYEEDAEQLCEKSIMQALDTDPDSLDAHQTLASLRLSQGRPVDASAIMETVFVRVKHIKDITKARTVVDEINGAPDIIEQDGNAII